MPVGWCLLGGDACWVVPVGRCLLGGGGDDAPCLLGGACWAMMPPLLAYYWAMFAPHVSMLPARRGSHGS